MEIIIIILIVLAVIIAFQVIGTLASLAAFLLSGLIIGALARLFVKGTGAMGLLRTILAGILGSFSGGILAHMLELGGLVELIIAIAMAALFVIILKPKSDHE